MKCPACGAIDDRVIDSRLGKDSTVIRRRRECLTCKKRFTTYERVEEVLPFVIKKDGRREAYDRHKIVEGMRRACQKRPISMDQIEAVADSIEQELMASACHKKIYNFFLTAWLLKVLISKSRYKTLLVRQFRLLPLKIIPI